jgi:release factor glutamine methyltransferase
MALKCPWVRVRALDVSPVALEVAQANAQRHQMEERIEFLVSDGLSALSPELRYGLILTNPPYIPTAEIGALEAEVRDHDPRSALDGGADGLDFYHMLAREGGALLTEKGQLMTEFGDGQADDVSRIFEEAGWTRVGVFPDLDGRPRIFIACRPV